MKVTVDLNTLYLVCGLLVMLGSFLKLAFAVQKDRLAVAADIKALQEGHQRNRESIFACHRGIHNAVNALQAWMMDTTGMEPLTRQTIRRIQGELKAGIVSLDEGEDGGGGE